jgi:hypothetical protein
MEKSSTKRGLSAHGEVQLRLTAQSELKLGVQIVIADAFGVKKRFLDASTEENGRPDRCKFITVSPCSNFLMSNFMLGNF